MHSVLCSLQLKNFKMKGELKQVENIANCSMLFKKQEWEDY